MMRLSVDRCITELKAGNLSAVDTAKARLLATDVQAASSTPRCSFTVATATC
jgi:hypothetical protein